MRNMKTFICISLISIFLLSCHNKSKKEVRETLEYFSAGMVAFDVDLVQHFPYNFEMDEIKEMYFVLPSAVRNGGCSIALLRTQPTQTKFDSLSTEIEQHNSSLLRNEHNIIFLPDSSDFTLINSPVFLPNFREVLDDIDETESEDFHEQFEIFLIESDSGNFTGSDQELLGKPYLPIEFEHGFSRGIAVDKDSRVIIYWLLIW